MCVIDTHTHLPGHSFGSSPVPIAELRRAFEDEGLGGAWIMTTDGLLADAAGNNDILASETREHRDFFVPFCTVNPHDGAERAIAELERAVFDLGMRGLKLHPWLQAFSLTHPAVLPVMRRAGELGLPVLFHDGTPPYGTPLQIAAAAEQVPNTTVILGHAGLDDLYHEAILACRRQANIYLCCCSLSSGYIRRVIESCPADRLLYGSDGGFGGAGVISQAIEKISTACDDDHTLWKILTDNPQRLLPL